MREMLKGMSLSDKKVLFSSFDQEKDQLTKIEDRRTTFLQLVTEWGYKTPTDFLIEGEIIPNPTVKKPRTKITDEVRQNIVTDLKSGTMTTKQISDKYGITTDSIYNIKGKAGLTKPRTKKVPSPSVNVPNQTVSDSDKSPLPLAT